MDAIAFLRKILPASGIYYSATPKTFEKAGQTKPYMAHRAFTDIVALAEHMLAQDGVGNTMYHACAAFKEEFYMEYDAKLGKDRKRSRTFKNMRSAKAFWTDLDCGVDFKTGEQKDYPDQKSALFALLNFSKATGFPMPMLVLSGYGVHAYWPLEEELLAPSWKEAADLLKRAMIQHGVKLDPSRGADGASVLRTPGTHNWKVPDDPKRVVLYKDAGPFNTAELVAKIRKIAGKAGVPLPKHLKETKGGGVDIGQMTSYPLGNADRIAEACAHMAEMQQTGGVMPEPMWYACLGVLGYCENGEEYAQAWSAGHPDFDAGATVAKLVQWKSQVSGPATCAYFESKGGGSKCATCAYKGKVSTPVQLGSIIKEAAPIDVEGHEIHPPPFPYTRAEDGIYVTIDKIADIKKKLYDSDIYISDIVTHPGGYEVAVIHYDRPLSGWKVLDAKTSIFNKLETSWEWFSNNGIYITAKETAEGMAMYMRSYLAELHQRKQALVTYTNLGWKEDGSFLAGQALITKDGKIQPLKNITRAIPIAKHMRPVGDMQKWVDAGKIFDDPELRTLGFPVLAAMGSLCGGPDSIQKAVINVVGPTGLGKSSIQRYVNALFGHPDQLLMSAKDTLNAIFQRIGTHNNIPFTLDEVGNMKPEHLSNLVLQITQGRDKQTLTQNRDVRHANEWNLQPIFSSNHSLRSKVSEFKDYSGAESARLIELTMTETAFFNDPDKPRRFNETLLENYGKAGIYLVRHIVKTGNHGKDYKRRAEEQLKQMGLVFKGQDRFHFETFVSAAAGGIVGSELGLVAFNWRDVLIATYNQLLLMREDIAKEHMDSFDLISLFINQHYDKIIVVEYGYQPQPIITHDTRGGEILGRISIRKNSRGEILREEGYVCLAELKTWLARRMNNLGVVRTDLMNAKALISDRSNISLGADTHYAVPPRRCMVLNMQHPRLRTSYERKDAPTAMPANFDEVATGALH